NGINYTSTWTSVKVWSVSAIASPGTNVVSIQGYDPSGKVLSNVTATVTVNYTGPVPNPVGTIVFNEIMYRPAISNASYVEIFNSSTTSSFDLANWRVDGLEYSFGSSTLLTPRSFLVLTKSRSAYLQAFPTNPAPFAEFIGNLD